LCSSDYFRTDLAAELDMDGLHPPLGGGSIHAPRSLFAAHQNGNDRDGPSRGLKLALWRDSLQRITFLQHVPSP
jgi:hypothetical protein